jgi:hypothetical protein
MTKKSVTISVLTAIIVSVCCCELQQQYLSANTETPVLQSEQKTDIEQQANVEPEPSPEPEPEPSPEPEPEPAPESEPEPVAEPKAEPEPEAATAPTTDAETAKKPAEKSEKPLKEKALPAFYKKCDHIFATYVDKQGLVNYKTLRRKRRELLDVMKDFDDLHPAIYMSWSNNEKIAFWINAYNIFTLKLIVDNYPIKARSYLLMFYPKNSVMHIPGAWNKKIFNVMGIEYTLQEIEQEMLLQKFNDPRIGFALSLASMSSPPLLNKCYYPNTLGKQLDEQMTRYMANPKGLQINNENQVIKLSDIFKRYKEPIIKRHDSIKKFRKYPPHIKACLNFIIGHVSADVAQAINTQNYTISFQQYDWGLNEQPKK